MCRELGVGTKSRVSSEVCQLKETRRLKTVLSILRCSRHSIRASSLLPRSQSSRSSTAEPAVKWDLRWGIGRVARWRSKANWSTKRTWSLFKKRLRNLPVMRSLRLTRTRQTDWLKTISLWIGVILAFSEWCRPWRSTSARTSVTKWKTMFKRGKTSELERPKT